MTDHPKAIANAVHLCAGLVLLAALAPAGCRSAKSSDKGNVSGPAAAVQTTTYHGVGIVKQTNIKLPSVEIDHQEIVGLMPAMTMEFYVQDKSLLDGLKPGDRIDFTIENGVGGIKITAIRKQ